MLDIKPKKSWASKEIIIAPVIIVVSNELLFELIALLL